MNKDHLDEVLQFTKAHRSNEANFEKLLSKLEEEAGNAENSQQYTKALQEIKVKQAEEYRQAKATAGTAWPEFENFISAFEKAITEVKNGNV